MTYIGLNGLRKQLLLNGYHPLPNKDKQCFIPGWASPEYVARELSRIESWPERWPDFLATGVRLDNGLGAIDGDVDDQALSSKLWDIVEQHAPDVLENAPIRYGGGKYKAALFVRIAGETFNRIPRRVYVRPEELERMEKARAAGEKIHIDSKKVEIFGGARTSRGNCANQFGIYGPHSHNKDGSVAREYRWHRDIGLREIPLTALPVLTKVQALAIAGAFEKAAEALGWVAVPDVHADGGSVVYDIDETTRFDTNRSGHQISYDELCEAWEVHGDSLRCSSNFMPRRGLNGDRERCSVLGGQNRHGCVVVHVHNEGTHYPKKFASAPDRVLELVGKIMLKVQSKKEPPEPANDADINEKSAWLVQTRGYFESEDSVVRLYDTSLDCRIKPSAFERRHKSWFVKEGTPARPRFLFATDLWSMTPQRINIAGVRMRPDRAFPTYEEDGHTYKNTYQRPLYAVGGDIAEFMVFMERFIPDAVEREWLFDWMAHKQMRPDIPGTSVFFVADTEEGVREGTFGTGRGLMFRIARQLYGPQYVRAQSFGMLDGSSGQSVFNDWLHGTVLVTVDESKTSPTAYRRGERSAAYEVLKELVDPAPKLHRFNGKNRQAFDGMSYCSIWVATNHGNAMAIPAHDRRFTILRNGREIRPEEVDAIVTWMDVEANIGALSEWLDTRDIGHFNMFQPLATVGKAEMAEMALSDVEEYLRDIMEDERRGLVFAKEHIEKALEHNFNGHGQVWRGEFKAAWHAYCAGLKGPTGLPRRVRMMGTQRKLFCFRDRLRVVKNMPEAAIRREVAKWGGLDPSKGLLDIKGLNEIDETLQ